MAVEARTVRRVVVGLLVAVVVAWLAFFPVRNYLDQQSETSAAEAELERLDDQIADLEARLADLDDPQAALDLAREELGFVPPGEEPFTVLPQGPTVAVPTGWPFDVLRSGGVGLAPDR